MKPSKANSTDTKMVFLKKGTCSRTMFYILNREFGHPKELEEQAIDPMAGGILQQGYQCGLLWGAVMGVGAESFRRCDNTGLATAMAITATQYILKSFVERSKSTDCFDITDTNFNKKFDFAKYMLSGKFISCFKLADKWAPEALKAAHEGLSQQLKDLPEKPKSCASIVVKRMGANEEQMIMVAGLAGGIGLSGNGCGALGAAIWMKSIKWLSENPKKSGYPNPYATAILETFMKAADYELTCHKICGRSFETIADHTVFIENGGCERLIYTLSNS